MNKGLFRLIFSVRLGMFIPAAECVASRAGRSSGTRSRRRALAALLAAAMHGAPAMADQPAGLVQHATLGWANANIASSSASQMTIQQTAPKAILNWQQLNLNRGESLTFNQGGNRSWAALNRIHDANPSLISGNVKADGHLYFVNGNGIIFGNGAQINAGSLTASTLDVTDDLFNNGIFSDPTKAVFSGTGGFVRVEQGAALAAASGGRVLLLAKDVTNSGVIATPDGQTILAAGEKVYLADSADPAGLLVEVSAGGTAKNLGEIVAQRGNVTLVGLAVNQEGRISASTSVRANGSIHLLARDTVNAGGGMRYGKVVVGQASETVVSAETGDKEEVLDQQVFTPSRIRIEGRSIEVDGLIEARGGNVAVEAKSDAIGAPAHTDPEFQGLKNRVYLGEHARIDVSGLDATAPMSRHQLEIQLYSDQLKDTPLLRGGALFGEKIYVDARKGTPLTDIAPFLALKGRTVAEKLSQGGTVSLNASSLLDDPGDVIVRQGAVVDVSGGSITYQSGLIRESSLRYNGKLIPIAEATPDKIYQGTGETYSVTDPKWGVTRTWTMAPSPHGTMQQGYSDGSAAGSIRVAADKAALEGTFRANTRAGVFQRETPPDGGAFNVALNSAVRLVQDVWKLPAGFAAIAALPVEQSGESQLGMGLLRAGFDDLDLKGGQITVDTAVRTSPKGSVKLAGGGGVAINADIVAPGGSIDIAGGEVRVANGVTLSTAGLWTNDTPGLGGAQTAPIALDGGNISLTGTVAGANALALGENTLLDAGAGAWLASGGKLKGGKGGNITLGGLTGLVEGQVQSYGFSKGGELTLSTLQDVQAGGQQPVAASALWLPESFFGQGGFSKYTVNASAADADLLIGDAGGGSTVIHPQMQTLRARSGFAVLASGNPIQQVAEPALPPDHLRSPASMSFTSGDDLVVFTGATLRTDNPSFAGNKGSISLAAGGQMTIAGNLIAPGGNLSATITGATPNFDYDNTLSLFVAETARLLAAGYYALTPSNGGLLDAKVLNGGNITLDGGQRAAVVTRAGSLLDVSGVSGQADVAGADGYARETLHGAAGSIAISSRNGLALDGDLRGVATGAGAGGTLALALNGATETPRNVSGHPDHPNGARLLTVTQNRTNRADGLQAGDALDGIVSPGADLLNPDDDAGTGAISAQQISEGGFDRVSLKVSLSNPEDRIVLPSGLNLDVPTALTLDAGLLEVTGNGTARVSAPHVSLTSAVGGSAPVAGDARLEVAADFIDLSNSLAVAGVKSTLLDSRTDIRGRGFNSFNPGSLAAPGEIVLRARQIYPVTNGQFLFEATGANSRIEVQPGGATPEPVLTAGGQLTLKADEIVQGGALLAPLGQITLDAADKLTLMPGSLTSVSADGQLIPYGLTRLGGMDMLAPTTELRASELGDGMAAMPDKRVSLRSADIDMQAGAEVDISGGGDTLAYEWIEGIGGSRDILGQAGIYAVIPAMRDEYAPFDYNYQNGSDLKPGDAVYLSGIPGLAAGAYTLLPGRYALLPGAFMVEASTSRVTPGRAVPQPGGATLVSGYRTTLDGSSRDAAYSTFRVTDGSIFRDNYGTSAFRGPAEYRLTTGNPFFREQALNDGRDVPRLASDAGQLVLDASTNLMLGADLLTGKADGARGAQVDIVSGRIRVVSAIGAEDGTLQLTADSLNALNAESLLLGGTRSYDSNGMSIVTNADRVTFANDAEHALEASELVAVAKDTLTLDSGAVINTAESKRTTGVTRLHASGDGALLAVSSLNDIEFDRSGASASPATGTLDVVAGASIQAGRSLVLDSTLAARLNGNIDAGAGGSATLGANRILLGDSGNETGLKLDDAAIANLGDIARLTLNSRSNIDVYGPVSFGNRNLDLIVNAGGIAGHLADNQIATLTANKLALENSAGAAYLPPTGATGAASSLEVNANSITFSGNAGGKTVIGGFETASLNAAGEVIFKGAGSTEINANQTNITSARIGAATGADYTLATTGALATAQAVAPAALPDAGGLGAKLKMMAATGMNLGGNVELPSGQFTAQATAGDLIVANGASIKVASVPVAFDKFTRHTPGGSVTLQADAGNVYTETGSTINVSGGAGGDAGTLKVAATSGSVAVGGTLDGQAVAGQQAGSFVLDTGTLDDFSALNTRLNEGGFTASRDMRVRNGDVAIAADDTVNAQQFVLSADAGKIDIAGAVNADGASGGNIEIYARDSVTLKNTARLLARGTADTLIAGDRTTGAGGSVMLSSLSKASIDAVSAETGALVDVSGDQQGAVVGNKGSVTMRAYRGTTGNTNTVNVAFGATAAVRGAEEVRLEGVRVYHSATFAANTSTIVADTNAFYNANPGQGSYAATQDGSGIRVLPNIEVRSTGAATPTDMTVSGDLNLRAFGALQAGKGGTLTLRANKDLKVNGSLSDGFSTAAPSGLLQAGDTFFYDLIAGADFSAANPMATEKSAASGNFDLASNKLIRTGTGGIRIAAGGGLNMGNEGSVIYTAGTAAADVPGFVAPELSALTSKNGRTAASYLTGGGDIAIRVQGNITGKTFSGGNQQTVNQWLFRQGGGTGGKDVSWWVRPDLFKQGVAAFGGGNVMVEAGGNITNFSASVPTTARYTDDGSGNFSVDGGGNVLVRAVGDIRSGVYHAGRGDIRLIAGGEIGAASGTFGTALSLQDASAEVAAVSGASIETVFNPTLWAQSSNVTNTLGTNGDSSFFLTYGDGSAFRISSLAGDVRIGLEKSGNIKNATGLNNSTTAAAPALELHPGTVEATSFSGNIALRKLVMAPSPNGNLSLLAAGNVSTEGAAYLAMSDADPALVPGIANPLASSSLLGTRMIGLRTGHAATPLHADDDEPVTIVAANGSITMVGDDVAEHQSTKGPGLALPKAAYIRAGGDITLNAHIQHTASSDLTSVSAGGDFRLPSGKKNTRLQIAGPGELLVKSGRNMDLADTSGILSVANTTNSALPDQGASITLMAGLGEKGADVAGYVARYIAPAAAGSDTLREVAVYMRQLTGNSGLSETDAKQQYLALDADRQAVFANRHFSSELLASGKGFAGSGNHERGDAAVAAMFGGAGNGGDLLMYKSQVRTLRGGSIDLLLPGGLANAGVPSDVADLGHDIGVVTERGGAIRAFAETGFLVNQSKVITQYGGDITVWVNNGDIDAGRGSKTAVSVPKREVLTDADGNTAVEFKGVAAGSGIRAQTYDPDGPDGAGQAPELGSVALIAPRGVLNAGEAGIAAGNFLAVATQVVGAGNIQVSGSSAGVPQADTGSLAGALAVINNLPPTAAGPGEVARQAAQSASNPAQPFMPSFITVDVIGLGEQSPSRGESRDSLRQDGEKP